MSFIRHRHRHRRQKYHLLKALALPKPQPPEPKPLLANATTLTLIHNHPSGNARPSGDDDRITHKLKTACDAMRLYLIDHLIVTDGNYYSYAEEGKI